MLSNKIPGLVQWWMTPKLPREHIFVPKEKRPKELDQIFRLYSRKWMLHPIKRRVAKYYLIVLQQFFGIKVIGITGSCGKTTTKEMVASILRTDGETVATYANIDPVYNIPTTILKCRPSTKYLVLEMGVEYPGEMDYYLWLARPIIAVITNIHPTHTQFFKSSAGVAEEKVKLISSLAEVGYAVLNCDNYHTKSFKKKTKGKVITFGKKGDVKAEGVEIDKNYQSKFTLIVSMEKISIQMSMLGSQFISNALAAASVGHLLDISLASIKKGVEKFNPPAHRMKLIRLKSGAIVLDDSYNNNPAAARKSLETLLKIAKDEKTIVVFGDMLELGEKEKYYHRLLGKIIAKEGIDCLIGVGQASKTLVKEAKRVANSEAYFWVDKEKKVGKIVRQYLKKDSIVLVKGSRSIGLDRLVLRLSR